MLCYPRFRNPSSEHPLMLYLISCSLSRIHRLYSNQFSDVNSKKFLSKHPLLSSQMMFLRSKILVDTLNLKSYFQNAHTSTLPNSNPLSIFFWTISHNSYWHQLIAKITGSHSFLLSQIMFKSSRNK